MSSAAREWLAKKLQNAGMKLSQTAKDLAVQIPETSAEDRALLARIAPYTMSLPVAQWSLIQAIRHIQRRGVEGDFVECGVWRGGNLVLARTLLDPSRQVWGFDTFEGMTAPTEHDSKFGSTLDADTKFRQTATDSFVDWCYASIEDVQANLAATGCVDGVTLVKGDVRKTLLDTERLPEKISILRLDTDFYDSTLIELEALYPRVAPGGVVIVDDYGVWAGAKKAVDEYFGDNMPWLHYVTRDARLFIKEG